jgi:hypothetical protein
MYAYTWRQHVTFPHQLTSWYMHISQYYSCHPDCYWYPYDHMCIASYDTANSDCLKGGANMCLCPLQECTMNYSYKMYLPILYCPTIIQQLIGTSFMHAIHFSERLEYFCMLKSCLRWSCASDEIRSSATYGYIFLNYIGLFLWSSYLRDYMSILSICSSYLYAHLIYLY